MQWVIVVLGAWALLALYQYRPMAPQRYVVERRHFCGELTKAVDDWHHSHNMTPKWLAKSALRREPSGAIKSGSSYIGGRYFVIFDDLAGASAYAEIAKRWVFQGDRAKILIWSARGWSSHRVEVLVLSGRAPVVHDGPLIDLLS